MLEVFCPEVALMHHMMVLKKQLTNCVLQMGSILLKKKKTPVAPEIHIPQNKVVNILGWFYETEVLLGSSDQ